MVSTPTTRPGRAQWSTASTHLFLLGIFVAPSLLMAPVHGFAPTRPPQALPRPQQQHQQQQALEMASSILQQRQPTQRQQPQQRHYPNPTTFQSIRITAARGNRSFRRMATSSSLTASSLSEHPAWHQATTQIHQHVDTLTDYLETLRQTSAYFRYFSVDILASCEYIPQELFECYTETCEIYPVEEDEIPSTIREVDQQEYDFALDGWGRWDMPSEDYYDTEEFEEGYTGYDGAEIWNFIHERICFEGYGYNDGHWKSDYNKVVSGLHAMIAAQVVRGIQEKVDAGEEFTADEKWRDPQAEYNRRLSPQYAEIPSALENLYFTFLLIVQAVGRVRDRLLNDPTLDATTLTNLQTLYCLGAGPSALLYEPSTAVAATILKEHTTRDSATINSLWEARMRTRDLMRIMNCVQCNKCRLHGKISVMGVSTALKILVGKTGEGEDPGKIHRVELATLMATLHKFARAISFCKRMEGK